VGYARAALGLLFVARTTPLSRWLPAATSHVATPLLGWPEHGFRAPWGGLALPASVVVALCVVRTVAGVFFLLGAWTRVAGTVAAAAGLLVMSQDAFGFKFTLYTLFVGSWLVALSGGGGSFALRPSPPDPAGPRPWLVQVFVASVYGWAAIAKIRPEWLSGETLRGLYRVGYLTGPMADALFATVGRCQVDAWAVVIVELALGPLLLHPRTRLAGFAGALAMHATYEVTARPDVYGYVMAALLLSFAPTRRFPAPSRGARRPRTQAAPARAAA
jgi:hypothetical protein